MIGFRWKRGNVQREQDKLRFEKDIDTLSRCENTGTERLKKAFERIGDFNKPIPKKGRPFLPGSIKSRRRDRMIKAMKKAGVLFLFE